jgi:hypothetical protein
MQVRGSIAAIAALMLAGMLVVCTAPAGAQTTGAQSTGAMRIPIPNVSYIGFNPLGIPFDIFTVEAETGVAQGVTIGGLASHISLDDDRYTSFDFKVRYYPGEVVLRGFSLGATAGYLGYSTITSTTTPGFGTGSSRVSLDTPTIGIIADYNWLLGSEHRFVVGTGLGAKRVLAGEDERARVGLDRAFLTGRFTVGLAF